MNSMIIEKLKQANVITNTGFVILESLENYVLTHDILVIMYDDTLGNVSGPYLRAVVEKWTFQDKAMGEQFITFDFLSEQPVAWAVNDYCIFRGERFVLNYIPSVTQKGRRNAVLDSYKYEGVKFNSLADELTRCQMLDVVLTSGDPNQGTNYTGSSKFDLFCGETTVGGVTRTAVMTLGDRILANLNRMYRDDQEEPLWTIVYGDNTHSEDQMLSFDNQYVSEALAMIKSKFDLNYAVKGRTIYIGCELGDVADVKYGYGPGYPTEEAGGKGLFELKKISDSSQQIVTRLRVLGSTKNLPYRYYNKAYELPQALFPLNLQLPDTFLPMTGTATHKRPGDPDNKTQGNSQRSSSLRAVKGATNDAYLDKGDDAEATPEGVREATIRFDGSDSKLKEIYPTIEDVTYDELRGSNVPDQEGTTGENAFPNYEADEKVNELLAIGYKYEGQMCDDANVGSGILSDDNGGQAGSVRDVSIPLRTEIMTHVDDYYCGTEQTLFTVSGQTAGKYFFTPVMNKEPYFSYSPLASSDPVGFIIRVKATSGGTTTVIAEYKSDFYSGKNAIVLPSIPDVFYMADAKVREIALSGTADITVTFIPCTKIVTALRYWVGPRQGSSYTAQYVWNNVNTMDSSNMPFHVFVKDMGVDFESQFNGETPAISMKSGECVGREFQISAVEKGVEYDGKKGYMLTLNRASDSSLNTYYPNSRNNISADDQFVIIGIDMPDAYIRAAEMRLLAAATEWLAENGDTNFHYQPAIDDIYLKRNYDNMVALNTPEDSVFWKLYAGYDLTFHPIPAGPSDPEPSAISVTIESVTITMGEGLTRKVDILLNDELKESTLKRVTQEVKDLNNKVQSVGSGMSTATMETTVRRIGDKQYLSKVDNDEAAGDIIFHGTIRFDKNAMFAQGAYFGENADGTFNTEIDPVGNIRTARNVEAMWGVSARGIATLETAGAGGGGTVTGINVNGTLYEPSQGLITLPDYPTAASLISDGLASQSYVQSYFSDNFTQANIKSTLGIYDWALATSKPSYNFSEIGSKPTTLAGYGITDAHITNGVVTLGGNAITPATLTNGKIPLSQIPDAILGQLIYGGTVNGSGVVTLSQNAKDKWGITSLTLTSTNYSTYEGAFFIASADATSGVPSTLGLLVGDWVVATASGWGKIDNTDAVTGVKGDAESSYRIGNVNITKGNIGLGNVENTALSTWAGTSNITTLGTIATGVWHGTAIGYDYLASGVQTSLGKADTVRGYFDTNGLLNKANHYNPASDSSADYSASASGATAAWSIDVVKGVQIQRDAKGHIIGVTVTSGKIPAKPTYAFSDLTSHPTTLSGYGITDGVNGLQKSGSGYLSNVDFVEGNPHSLYFTFTSFAKAQIGHTGGTGSTAYQVRVKADGAWSDYLALQQAGASAWGIVTDQAQTFGGDKTFNGNIHGMKGVSARGIATLEMAGGGAGTVTSIQFGSGTVITANNGLLSVSVGQGTSNGQIKIGGQDISVKGLAALAYLPSLAFGDLTTHPTTLGGYGITDAKIANGVITLGSNSITPLTSHQTLYNLVINNSAGTAQITYKPAVSGTYALTLTKAMVGLSNVENTKLSTWTGSANITTLGTITTGKWQGTAIADSYIASAATWNAKQDAISDLSTIRSRADEGHTAYGWGNHATAGYLTGNQTITLSGDVSGSGATSIAVTIGTGKVTNAMLAGSIANNKLVNSSISIAGTSVSLGGSISAATLKSNLGLGASAYLGYDTTVTKDSAKLITSGAVWTAIDNLPEPMVFKGSLGTGGTITSLPTNGSASIGDTYKVITAGTYASKAAKVGDTFICLTKTSSANTWELIPSGDEPSGTVTSVGLSMPTGFSVSSSPVTSSGTLTVAFASGYSLPTTAKQGNWDDAYDKRHTHSSLTLSTTAQAYDGTHTLALPASDPYTSARTPSSHASSATTYGVGTTSNYGHVKLATGDMNGATGADGVAVGKNHTHSQYAVAANLGTASTHAHGDYVTAIGVSGNTLTWSKGGTAQTAITVPYATTAGSAPASDVYAWAKASTKPSYTASEVGALKNYGNDASRPNGTSFTMPVGANPVSMRSGATSGADIGIFWLSDDNAFVCNSSDNSYLFAAFDTDKTANFSTADNAAFAVLSDHAGVSMKGNLTVAGSITSGGTAVVLTNDSRLSDARPASDVYAWAKAATKPSYTASEVGAENLFRYGGQGSTTKIKIKINSTTNWMLCFTVTLYQGYRATKVMVSGYQYGSNYWYQPEACILGDSDGTETISVYFGYDSAKNLWVGFDGGNYTGVSINDVTNGYTQITNFDGLFTITNESSLTTIQETVTAQSKANYANSAGSVAWTNVSDRPTKLSQFTDDLGTSPTHSHSQYAVAANLGTASTHAHGDYVTAIGVSGNTLTWSKGGTAQTAITVPYATSAGGVAWSNVSSRPTKLSDFTDDLGSSPIHTHSQYVTSVKVGTTAYNPSSGVVSLPAYPTTLPASDVYQWAKEATKPSYNFNEIGAGAAVIGDGTNSLQLRTTNTWRSGIYYHTNGDEAMVFAAQNTRTSWIFANTDPTARTAWTNLSPAMHIKNGKVAIGKLIANGTYLTYALEVNGDVQATNFRGALIGNADTATTASKLSTVSKTAWGRTFWTANGVPDSISGDMSSVGNISFSASGKNIGGLLYFDTTNGRLGVGVTSPLYKLHVGGDIVANGGVAARGIVTLDTSGAGISGAVTQINVGSTPYTPTDGIVSLPASFPASDVSAWAKASSRPTYTTSIETSTGTNQRTLAFGTKYALNAGDTSYIFTMPSLPSGSTSQAGVVQLSSATNSTSNSLAATASAVKAAYDLASEKASKRLTMSTSTASSLTMSASTDASYIYWYSNSVTSVSLAQATSAISADSCGTVHYILFRNVGTSQITVTLSKYNNSNYQLISPAKSFVIPARSSVEISYVHFAASALRMTVVTIGDIMSDIS